MAGDNEPRLRVASSHSGADFDLRAGSPRSPHGEAPNDGAEHEVANAREPEQTRSGNGAQQRGLDSFLSGTYRIEPRVVCWGGGARQAEEGGGDWQAVQLPGQEAHHLQTTAPPRR